MASKKIASKRGSKEVAKPYRCDECNLSFARPSHLARHKVAHRPEGQRNHACAYCGKTFTRNDVLLRHLRGVHQTYPQPGRIGQRSCSSCVRRKSRCDRCWPCQSCVNSSAVCRYPKTDHQHGGQADPVLGAETEENLEYQVRGETAIVESSETGDNMEDPLLPDEIRTQSPRNDALSSPHNTLKATSSSSEILNDLQFSLSGCEMPSFDEYIDSGVHDSMLGQGLFSSVGLEYGGFDWLYFEPQEPLVDSDIIRNAHITSDEPIRDTAPSTALYSRVLDNNAWPSVPAPRVDVSRQNVQPWPFDQGRGKNREQLTSRYELPPLEQVLRDNSRVSSHGTKSALEILIDMLSKSYIPEDWSQDYSVLPGVHLLQRMVDRYFAEFHDILPVIHVPTFSLSKAPTVLLASMSCVGAMLLRDTNAEETSAALCDISSRMILWLGGQDSSNYSDLSYLTASCLHQIYSLGSGNRQLYQDADRSRGVLIGSLRGMGLLMPRISIDPDILPFSPTQAADSAEIIAAWLRWRDQEQEKRLTWASFEYDCTLSTLTGRRGAVDLGELPKSLPCVEDLWRAPSAQVWRSLASKLPSSSFGGPVAEALDAAMSGKKFPLGTSSWGKRLCCQIVGRLLWDLKQLAVLNLIRGLRLPSLGSIQEQVKAPLLQGFDNLSKLIKNPVSVQELTDYNIANLAFHYSHLFSIDDIMDLVIYIVRHLPTTPQSPHYGIVNSAKQNLATKFASHPRKTRKLIWHAAQITAVTNEYIVSAPCEILRIFMGAVLLIAVAKYYPDILNSSDAFAKHQRMIRLDYIDTTDEGGKMAECWIQHGGPASVLGVEDISSTDLGSVVYSRTRSLLEKVQFWGLSRKFIKILQVFQEADP